MKYQARLTVYGMKASKGDYEGVEFDSTKLYTLMPMDEAKGNAKGQAAAEFNIGDSGAFDSFKHLPFPFEADVEIEVVTTGKQVRQLVRSVRPVDPPKQPK